MARYVQPDYRLGEIYWVGLSTAIREVDWPGYERRPIRVLPGVPFLNDTTITFPVVPESVGLMTWEITKAVIWTTGPMPGKLHDPERVFVRTLIRRTWVATMGTLVRLYPGDLTFG